MQIHRFFHDFDDEIQGIEGIKTIRIFEKYNLTWALLDEIVTIVNKSFLNKKRNIELGSKNNAL